MHTRFRHSYVIDTKIVSDDFSPPNHLRYRLGEKGDSVPITKYDVVTRADVDEGPGK